MLPWQLWGLVVLAMVTGLNLLRIDLSIKSLAIVVTIETLTVAVWQVVVFAQGGPDGYATTSFDWSSITSGNVGLAVLFSMASLIGLESTAVYREETRDPDRTIPRATYSAIGFMALFYGLGIWAYIVAVGPSHAVDEARNHPVDSFFDSVTHYLGSFTSTLVSILLVTSVVAAINSTQSAAARYLYTMGRDRVLWARLAAVHPRLKSPYVAVLVTAAIALVAYLALIALGDDVVVAYGAMTGFGTVCILVLLIGTCLGVVAFFRRHPGKASVWQSTVAPVLALIGVGAVLVTALFNMADVVGDPVIGYVVDGLLAGIVLTGVLVARRLRRTRPETYHRIGRSDLEADENAA